MTTQTFNQIKDRVLVAERSLLVTLHFNLLVDHPAALFFKYAKRLTGMFSQSIIRCDVLQ